MSSLGLRIYISMIFNKNLIFEDQYYPNQNLHMTINTWQILILNYL